MNFLKKLISLYFSPERLLKPEKRLAPLPKAGELYSRFFALAWPSMIESAVVAMTSFVDTMMVGSLSDASITAVGITNQPRLLVFAIFFSLNCGIIAVVSRLKGAGDREGANRAMHQGLLVCFLLAVAGFILSYIYSEPIIRFAGAKDDTINDAVMYFRYTVFGVCFNSLGMAINAAQRACSRTKIALRTSLVANGVNVVFNYLLINGNLGFPAMGVEGAAIATMLGNILACLVSFMSVLEKDGYLKLDIKELFSFRLNLVSSIGRVSMGAAAEQVFMRIGMFTFAKIVAELGTEEFATHQICMTLISLSFAVGDGLAVAASALVGQNLGAKRSDLSELNARAALRVGTCISLFMFTLFATCGRPLMDLFTDSETIIDIGVKILLIVALVAPAQIQQVIYTGCLRGAGDTKYTAAVSFVSIAVIRPAIAYILCYPAGIGVIGAWVALFTDQTLRFLGARWRFGSGKWKQVKLGLVH